MFARDKVTASGKIYERGGSKAIVKDEDKIGFPITFIK
jgi:hypothetical protein